MAKKDVDWKSELGKGGRQTGEQQGIDETAKRNPKTPQ
jgi:hypothetical protein